MDEEEFDSQLSHLLECFPAIDFEILTEAILESEGSLTDAIDYVLARSFEEDGEVEEGEGKGEEREGETEKELLLKVSEEVAKLKELFPSVEIKILDAFVTAHYPEKRVEVLSNELMRHLGSKEAREFTKGGRRKISWARIEDTELIRYCSWFSQRQREESSSSPKTTKDLIRTILYVLEELAGSKANINDDPQDFRDAAEEIHRERSGLLAKAAQAHGRGGLTGKSSAQYYASEASKLGKRMEALHRLAALATFHRL